jgi:hypothetical protein
MVFELLFLIQRTAFVGVKFGKLMAQELHEKEQNILNRPRNGKSNPF